MGQSYSSQFLQQFDNNFQQVEINNNSIIQDGQVFQNQLNLEQFIMKIIKNINQKKICDFENRIKIENQNILKIINVQRPQLNLNRCNCQNTQQMTFYIEWQMKNLRNEIQKRGKIYFSEDCIWYFARTVIDIVIIFQQNNIEPPQINSKNILIDTKGQLFMFDSDLILNESCQFSERYFAPEEEQRFSQNIVDFNQSMVFSLGVLLLESSSFMNVAKCYDYDEIFINDYEIDRNLLIIKKKYSKQLFEFIEDCLNYTPNIRPSLQQLYLKLLLLRMIGDQINVEIFNMFQ